MQDERNKSNTNNLWSWWYDPTKPNNNVVEVVTAMISDAQLTDESETKALAKADELIDAITNMAGVKVFLKRLCLRLKNKGLI